MTAGGWTLGNPRRGILEPDKLPHHEILRLRRSYPGWLLPFVLSYALWNFLLRGRINKQGLGGMVNVGRSEAGYWFSATPG